MNVEQSNLENIIRMYVPECRYLVSAELDFPIAKGLFKIPTSFYVSDTGHFNAVELIICYNQLAYVLFAEYIKVGLIKEFREFPFEKFKQSKLASNCFIVGMNNVKFRRPINPREFRGNIKVVEVISKKNNSLYFLKTEYDFENGKQTGEIDLALVI